MIVPECQYNMLSSSDVILLVDDLKIDSEPYVCDQQEGAMTDVKIYNGDL